jgi:Trk K+ transport system NAD-binding subunit
VRVIVCGLGQVGYRVALLLARLGEEVTVVTLDPREEFVEQVREAGCKVLSGDARNERNLIEAGVSAATSVVICMDDDLANIEVALDARRLNPEIRVVVRIFDQNLARRLEETLAVTRTLGMSMISAPAFAAAALGESVRGSFSIEGDSYVVGRIGREAVEANSAGPEHLNIHADEGGEWVEVLCDQRNFERLTGRPRPATPSRFKRVLRSTLAAINPRTIAQTLLAIWKNAPGPLKGVAAAILLLSILSVFVFHFGMHLSAVDSIYFVVTTVTTVGYGDITPKDSATWLKLYGCLLMLLGSASVATLYSIITDFVVSIKFDQMLGRSRVASAEHVIVVGLGGVGYRTVNELRRLGVEVVGIDVKPDAEFRTFIDRDVPFVAGDARDPDTLRRAGIDQATAILAMTENDAVNLSIGLVAKQIRPEVRSVLRLFNAQFAEKVRGTMDVDTAMSASRIAAPTFVGAALYDHTQFCYIDGDRFIAVHRGDVASDPEARQLTWNVVHTTLGAQTLTVTTRDLKPRQTVL